MKIKITNKDILIPFVIIESTQTKGEPIEISLKEKSEKYDGRGGGQSMIICDKCYKVKCECIKEISKDERKERFIDTLERFLWTQNDSFFKDEARKEFKQALDNLF